MYRFNKITLTLVFLFLTACNLTPALPEVQKVSADHGIWAIPLTLQSTILTRQLTESDNLEFKFKKLDGTLKEQITHSRFFPQPSFHLLQLPEGEYLLNAIRISGEENWYSEYVRFDIKPGSITVHPYIYEKNRYRVGSRHYREEFNTHDFDGERTKAFIQKMQSDKRVNEWKVDWPK